MKISRVDTRLRTPGLTGNHHSRKFPCRPAAPDDQLTIDHHELHPIGILMGIDERRLVAQPLEIQDCDVGTEPLSNLASILEA